MHAAAGLREPSRRVSPRARTMWVLTSVVEAALVLGVMIVVGPVLDWLGLPWWLFAIVGGAGAAYVVVVPPWRYAVHRWEVTDTAVYTQKGWWSLERRIAPMSRIQTVDLGRGAGRPPLPAGHRHRHDRLRRRGARDRGTGPRPGPGAGRGADGQGRRRHGRRHVSELARDEHWQRLDPRMLLVHPLRELVRFLPVIVAILLAGSGASGLSWELLGIGVPIALGVLRYLTTRFRITGDRIELQRGLLNRHVLSTPLDRVRTVDLTASLDPAGTGPDHRPGRHRHLVEHDDDSSTSTGCRRPRRAGCARPCCG